MQQRLAQAIERHAPEARAIAQDLYDKPELAFEEHFACKRLAEAIAQLQAVERLRKNVARK